MGHSRANDGSSPLRESEKDLVAWLAQGDCYPDRPEHVEVVETHISWVFLTRRYAYKLKKPVRFDFLDFSTLAARQQACAAELRLNRRLAPSTYLAVVPVVQSSAGTWSLGGEGEPVDYLVQMWRLPTARRLDTLVEQGRAASGDGVRLERTLARFYRALPASDVTPEEYLATFERHVLDNRRVLLEFAPPLDAALVKRIHAEQLRLLRLAPERLLERVRAGRVVEGHGDLRPEHVYLMPEPVVVDCIEFSADFRRIDIADELCFLAMELSRSGAAALGEQILQNLLASLDDPADERLLRFYKSYRASVRAKVAALRSRQQQGAARKATLREAAEYLACADSYHAPRERPLLLVVSGLMGTGKSTLARALAEEMGLDRLSTDELRREQHDSSQQATAFGEGKYADAARARVYEAMFARAEELIAQGVSVVLDGTFTRAALRDAARKIAQRHRARFALLRCECPPDVARERIARRAAAGKDASEARPELFDRQRQNDEPPGREALRVDTALPEPAQRAAVYRALAEYE